MSIETSIIDTKKHIWVKRLISMIVTLYVMDLKKGVKNPNNYQQYLSKFDDSLENVLDFWKNDAYVFLNFLFGHAVACKCMKKLNALVSECELKLKNFQNSSSERIS